MKKNTFLILFLSFLLLLSVTAFAGTIQLPQTGQTKCYDTAGTEINCTGTGQDRMGRLGQEWHGQIRGLRLMAIV